jgi:L-ascorbate metabolism protein UlaG (beta-lactamase superfamily)
MKITKFIHSCLIVEIENKNILLDPGSYTAEENALNIEEIDTLDYLLITHEHQDHMHLPFVKQIVKKFPEIKVMSNQSLK